MTPVLLQQFQQLVSQRTGLHVRTRELETFQAALLARMRALELPEGEAYYRMLESGTARAEREWPELASRLTNQESYFFRDQGQMALLRERILPELIERNRARRALRLWSAGCSTGEEAYTLAMLVDELLPHREEWQILILGTDLNPEAVAQAQRGIYGPWSFRMVDPAVQRRYFRPVSQGHEITAAVRQLVTFQVSNLVRDPFPDPRSGLRQLDLILCRNVFIYFEPEAVAVVMHKFAQTLRNEGYLLTGHAETQGQTLEGLQLRTFPESLAYQRSEAAPIHPRKRPHESAVPTMRVPSAILEVPPPPTAAPLPVEDPISASVLDLDAVETLYTRGDSDAVIASLDPFLAQLDYRGLYLLAQAHTHRGDPAAAVAVCRRACELSPLAVAPYQLLAVLVEDQGEYEEAKRLLKKVIYLAPAAAAAYLDLGALYAREGERVRARTMRSTALELLRNEPPDQPLEPGGRSTAGEWVRHVEALLAEGD